METATIKNDRDFEVTIKVKNEDGEEVEKVLKPGEEAEVPKDQSEAVLGQITDAEKPSEDGDGDGDGGDGEGDGSGDGGEGDGDGEGNPDSGKPNLSETERKELAELRSKQALSDTREMYQTLLSAGKITPAQEEQFMQLSKVHGQTVQLSKDKTVSLSEIVKGILEAGPKVAKFSESGSGKQGDEDEGAGDGDDSKKPSETLSEAESKGMHAVGADPKRMDELSDKYPEMKSALNQSKENK